MEGGGGGGPTLPIFPGGRAADFDIGGGGGGFPVDLFVGTFGGGAWPLPPPPPPVAGGALGGPDLPICPPPVGIDGCFVCLGAESTNPMV